MTTEERRLAELEAEAAGHSVVEGGNLTGHVLHAPGCYGCEEAIPEWRKRLAARDETSRVTVDR